MDKFSIFIIEQIKSLNVAYKISSTVPNAKVAIGHGQMDKNELEDVMLRFYE